MAKWVQNLLALFSFLVSENVWNSEHTLMKTLFHHLHITTFYNFVVHSYYGVRGQLLLAPRVLGFFALLNVLCSSDISPVRCPSGSFRGWSPCLLTLRFTLAKVPVNFRAMGCFPSKLLSCTFPLTLLLFCTFYIGSIGQGTHWICQYLKLKVEMFIYNFWIEKWLCIEATLNFLSWTLVFLEPMNYKILVLGMVLINWYQIFLVFITWMSIFSDIFLNSMNTLSAKIPCDIHLSVSYLPNHGGIYIFNWPHNYSTFQTAWNSKPMLMSGGAISHRTYKIRWVKLPISHLYVA